MPKRTDIQSILVIGAGPIVIGQACEFDYSGTQAIKALKEEGYRIVLVNSNPATIMTDPELADATYVEPITPEIVAKIIEKERPDAVLPTMGGQTALNTALALFNDGTLTKYGVEMIGADAEAIDKAEDRIKFRDAMDKIGLESARSGIAHTLDEAFAVLERTGLPSIIRPSFTMGGTGGGIAYNREEFEHIVRGGLIASLAVDTGGLYAVLAPLNQAAGKTGFEIVRLDASGKEQARRAFALATAGMPIGRTMFATALMKGDLYVAAARPPGVTQPARNDFGFVSLCHRGGGTHVLKLRAADLGTAAEGDLAEIEVRALLADKDGIVFAGAAREGCAWNGEQALLGRLDDTLAPQILWRDAGKAQDAASALRITAQDLKELKIIDAIIPEPLGGAHREPEKVIGATGDLVAKTMQEFAGSNADFREQRREKYLAMGRSL